MSRCVRQVPPNWEHPKDRGKFIPLGPADEYEDDLENFNESVEQFGKVEALFKFGCKPEPSHYMPKWKPEEATHFQLYETTSEGTPLSPIFATHQDLARWCVDNDITIFGRRTAPYDVWMRVARDEPWSLQIF